MHHGRTDARTDGRTLQDGSPPVLIVVDVGTEGTGVGESIMRILRCSAGDRDAEVAVGVAFHADAGGRSASPWVEVSNLMASYAGGDSRIAWGSVCGRAALKSACMGAARADVGSMSARTGAAEADAGGRSASPWVEVSMGTRSPSRISASSSSSTSSSSTLSSRCPCSRRPSSARESLRAASSAAGPCCPPTPEPPPTPATGRRLSLLRVLWYSDILQNSRTGAGVRRWKYRPLIFARNSLFSLARIRTLYFRPSQGLQKKQTLNTDP